MEKETLSIEEAAVVLGIGRTLAYQEARCGRIPTIRIGTRLLVPRVAIDKLLSEAIFSGVKGGLE